MAKDLGNKYVCFKCNAKFYDLKKPTPVCPKCGADQREAPTPKQAARAKAAAARQAEEAENEAEVETEEEEDDAEEEVEPAAAEE